MLLRQLHRRGPARFGDRDDDIDLVRRDGRDQALRQRLAEVQARLVDRDAVHDRVGPGQVHVLEHARVQARVLGALPRMDAAFEVDEDRLAGRDVAGQRVAGADDRHRFARHHHLGSVGPLAFAERQRPDAERVAKRQQAVPGDQRDHRVGALDAPMHRGDRREDLVRRELPLARRALELVREHVDQHLGVVCGVDVPAIDVEELLLERLRVGEVAVVHEHDAVGRVDVEGLRLFFAVGVAGRRVAHLAEAHRAGQRAHVAGAEHVAHHAARFLHEALGALHGDDAGRVLAAVLQQQQRVVDQLVDWRLRDHSDDSAHGSFLRSLKRGAPATARPRASAARGRGALRRAALRRSTGARAPRRPVA